MEDTETNLKTGFVAIIGRPNAGKSTLLNSAIGEKVAIVTPRPQTTRDRIRGILTNEKGQIVFIDTPGIHSPKGLKEINKRMVQNAMASLQEADLVVHVLDAGKSVRYGRSGVHPGDAEIRSGIAQSGCPAILVLNKVDQVKKPELLPLMERCLAPLEDGSPCPYTAVIPLCTRQDDAIDNASPKVNKTLWGPPYLFSLGGGGGKFKLKLVK